MARHRQARLGRGTRRRERAEALAHAAAGRGFRSSRPFSRPKSPRRWGLAGRKIPIAGGGGDNAASAVGVGAVEPGEGFVSLGTSGVIFSVTDKYVSLPERTLHAFCHALPGRWHGMSVMLSAASSLTWVAELIGRGDEIGALRRRAPKLSPVPPTRSPRRRSSCPISAASARRTTIAQATGMFAGLTRLPRRGRADLCRAGGRRVLLRRRRRRAGGGGRANPATPLLVGGGARSGFWGQHDLATSRA